MIVVGIDHDLLNDNLWVNHDDLQRMLTWSDVGEGGIEPTEVVEHLITTRQLTTIPETAQSEAATLWQWFQHFGTGEVLGIVLGECINETTTGIYRLHWLIVYLNADTQTTLWLDVLRGQDAEGNGQLRVDS